MSVQNCSVGANVGFFLRLPPSTLSVLWLPNAILTATLLLAPMRRWGIYLLAALPARLLAHLGVSWPLSVVVVLFAANCIEALVAAACVRRYSDAPTRFDTLPRLGVWPAASVGGNFQHVLNQRRTRDD